VHGDSDLVTSPHVNSGKNTGFGDSGTMTALPPFFRGILELGAAIRDFQQLWVPEMLWA